MRSAPRKKPARKAGFGTASRLEAEPHGQLDVARSTASEERIADAHIRRGDRVQETLPSTSELRRQRIGRLILHPVPEEIDGEVRQSWISKVGMVQQVENVGTELHCQALAQLRVFHHRKIKVA